MTGWSTARSACCARSTPGAASRLDRRGRRRRPALRGRHRRQRAGRSRAAKASMSRPARRAALQAAARRRHGFDHHRPGMHRRARRFAGLKDEIAAITERAMQGELDFAAALRERVALLAGLDEDAHRAAASPSGCVPNPGAATLVRTMRAGRRELPARVGRLPVVRRADRARLLGFDRVEANRLVFAGGKLSGDGRRPDRRCAWPSARR